MRSLLLLAALSVAIPSASADEGMWMPQQIPALAEELREMGLSIDPAVFADLTAFPMGAVVSLGGCSASFVSDQGLIVTNHHCVFGALQYNSTPERDLLNDGFLARTLAEELQATPSARVYVTSEIVDVTQEILGGLSPTLDDAARAREIEQRRKAMIEACERDADVRCQVSSFFSGEQFLKITALKIRDVRLVYAPALGVGNFGDEEDNWMWPRHTGDFGFYRAFVGRDGRPADYSPENVPYQPKHFLKFSTRDLDPGDLMLVAGYPGRTSRLSTADEVRQAQEFQLPRSIAYREALLEVLRERGREDRNVELLNASRISSLENYLKKHRGTLEAFSRDNLLATKLASEKELEAYMGRNPERAAEYRMQRDEFRQVLQRDWATRERDLVLGWLYTASPLLSEADRIVRFAGERAKPNAERDEGFQDRDRERLLSETRRAQRSIEPKSDRAGLRIFLLEATKLPAEQRLKPIDDALASTQLKGPQEQVEALLDKLYTKTQLVDLDVRLQRLDQDATALRSSDDAMLELAAALRVVGEENEERERARHGAEYRLRPQLIAALREMRQGRLAPDANGTLRVGFGVVQGYRPRDGVVYDAQTTVDGVLAKDTGRRPFDSPSKLLELARARFFGPYDDPEVGLAVDFLSTVSVTNGSSGSAALNAHGEIAGLAFDSNWEGVAADWVFSEDYVRTIHVDSRYLLWVMDAVDGAHNLLREMGMPVHYPTGGQPSGTRSAH